ncbi:hypothetical protein M5361_14160 [Ligilactobacillus agilis]|nr:hypothetical protein [Ligilactobacillus agilis]
MTWYTLREVSELSGISLNTLRQRFKRDYYLGKTSYILNDKTDKMCEVTITKRDIKVNPDNKLNEKLVSEKLAKVIIGETTKQTKANLAFELIAKISHEFRTIQEVDLLNPQPGDYERAVDWVVQKCNEYERKVAKLKRERRK